MNRAWKSHIVNGEIVMKKSFIAVLTAVTLCVCILFTGCDAVKKMVEGDEETTLAFTTNRTEVADEKTAAAEYYARILADARSVGAGLSRERKYEINDLNIVSKALEGKTDENGAQVRDPELKHLNEAAKEVRDRIAKSIGSSENVGFGEDWGGLAPAAPESLYLTDGSCAVVEEEKDDGTVEIKDERRGTLNFPDEEYPLSVGSVIAPIIPLPDEEEIKTELAKLSDYIALDDYGAVYTGSRIEFSVNRITDELNSASYVTEMRITAHAHGVGALEKYGELTVYLTLVCRSNYRFDYVDPNAAEEK